MFLRIAAPLLFCVLLSGCGGFHAGYFSRAYVEGDTPSDAVAESRYDQRQMNTVHLPGISVLVDLMNDVETSDVVVVALAVPTEIDVTPDWRSPEAGGERHCINLEFRSHLDGIAFAPKQTVLTVDAMTCRPVSVNARCERHPYRVGEKCFPYASAGEDIVSFAPGYVYYVDLCYPVRPMSPDRKIALDLDEAFQHPGQERIPPILFRRQAWKGSYS